MSLHYQFGSQHSCPERRIKMIPTLVLVKYAICTNQDVIKFKVDIEKAFAAIQFDCGKKMEYEHKLSNVS